MTGYRHRLTGSDVTGTGSDVTNSQNDVFWDFMPVDLSEYGSFFEEIALFYPNLGLYLLESTKFGKKFVVIIAMLGA